MNTMDTILKNTHNTCTQLCYAAVPVLLLLCLTVLGIQAQNATIKGLVSDAETGETLIAVPISYQVEDDDTDKVNGTQTDIDGQYVLDIPPGSYQIKATYLGYNELIQEITVQADSTYRLDFQLKSAMETMDEIVVVDSRIKKTKTLSYSVQTVTADEIAKVAKKGKRNKNKKAPKAPKAPKDKGAKGPAIFGASSKSTSTTPYPEADTRAVPVKEPAPTDGADTYFMSDDVESEAGESFDYTGGRDDLKEEASSSDKVDLPPSEPEISAGQLTAGEIHDFSKWDMWQDIATAKLERWQRYWAFKPVDRYAVQLTNPAGKPVVDATVSLKSKKGKTIWISHSDNTGKAELWANLFQTDSSKQAKKLYIEVEHQDEVYQIQNPNTFKNGFNHIEVASACNMPTALDVMFVVDATGSMGDEINYLKAELNDVITQVKKSHDQLELNLGSVFYRDKGDTYLTRQTPMSENIQQTVNFIKEQSANGGGDGPEAVETALQKAIQEMEWRPNAVARLLFLVLDAPPHHTDEIMKEMHDLTKEAAAKGIRIVPIAGSGIDKSTEYLMRAIALATNGTYVFLTDDSGIGGSHIKPTTDEYDVEMLNGLLIRLIGQYVTMPGCEEEEEEKWAEAPKADAPAYAQPVVDKDKKKWLRCYPNPTTGPLTLELKEDIPEAFVTDNAGKIIMRLNDLNKGTQQIDLGAFPTGLYFICYNKEGSIVAEKIMVTH